MVIPPILKLKTTVLYHNKHLGCVVGGGGGGGGGENYGNITY